MLTVYKYPISPSHEVIELDIPGGGPVLAAGLDPMGVMCVWAMANTEEPDEKVRLLCIGTGWPLNAIQSEDAQGLKFIAAVKDGPYMWHVFEEF